MDGLRVDVFVYYDCSLLLNDLMVVCKTFRLAVTV